MVMKTQADAEAALREILAKNHAAGPETQAAEVIAHLRVLPPIVTAASREEQPEPALNQRWRNRKSNRLVKIVSLGGGQTWNQIIWNAVDGSRGPLEGRVFAHYWNSRFDYVDEGE